MPEIIDSITGEIVPGAMETVLAPIEGTRQIDLTLVFGEREADRLLNLLTDPNAVVRPNRIEFTFRLEGGEIGHASFNVAGLDGWVV